MTQRGHVIFLIAVCLALTTCQAPANEGRQKNDDVVAEFYRLAGNPQQSGEIDGAALSFVAALPDADQLKVAQATALNPAASFRSYGISLLIKLRHEDDAVPKLAEMVAGGQDFTALYWGWIHSGDQSLERRMYLKLGRYFLSHADSFTTDGQRRFEEFLCQANPDGPVQPCSREGIAEKLEKTQ